VYHIRPFLFGDEVARRVFGQAGFYLGQDLGVLALGVELLQLRAQAGACENVADIRLLQGLRLGCSLCSFLMLASGEVPRAVRRAGRAWAPSTPGRLGYLAAEWLMDLGGVCSSSFPGLCSESFLIYRSPVISRRCGHKAGMCHLIFII